MEPRQSVGLAKPPEGALAGENVPRENERDGQVQTLIDRVAAELKSNGEPYTDMTESELKECAVKKLRNAGVIN